METTPTTTSTSRRSGSTSSRARRRGRVFWRPTTTIGLALLVAIVGCADSGTAPADVRSRFVGTWEVASRRQWAELQLDAILRNDSDSPVPWDQNELDESDVRVPGIVARREWLALPRETQVHELEERLADSNWIVRLLADGAGSIAVSRRGQAESGRMPTSWQLDADGCVAVSASTKEAPIKGRSEGGVMRLRLDGEALVVLEPRAMARLRLRLVN